MAIIPVATDGPAGLQWRLYEQHRLKAPVTQHTGQSLVRISAQDLITEAELNALERALVAPT